MPARPVQGDPATSGVWGTALNANLDVAIDATTGALKTAAVQTALGGSSAVFAKNYGLVADCQTLGDGAITNGLAALTSATGLFVVGDVGKTVIVAGAGVAGDDLRTTISAYVSATSVTLAATAGGTVSSATFSWGTDNKAAIDAALTALTPTLVGGRQSGGETLDLGPGQILSSGGHTWPTNVAIIGHGTQATNIIHTGNNSFLRGNPALTNYARSGLRGLTIWGNGGTSAVGVELRGKPWRWFFDHVVIGNYGAGVGLLVNNFTAGDFVEGTNANDLTLRYNLVGVEFRRVSGGTSFAYQHFLNFDIHVPLNGVGILVGDGANSTGTCQVYSGVFVGNIWLEGNSAVAVRIGQFGLVDNNTIWQVRGEIISGSSTKALRMDTGSIFYPRGIHDFAVSIGGTQATMDVANATTYRSPTRTGETLPTQKLIREAFPRLTSQGTTAPATGFEIAACVEFRRGDVVTGVKLGVTANGATLTLSKVGIWDTAGNLLASSADNSANFTAGSVPRVQSTALSAAYTVPADGFYFVGFLFVGTTAPTLVRGANFTGHSALAGDGDVLPCFQSAGGKTDVGNTSVNTTGVAYWFGAY